MLYGDEQYIKEFAQAAIISFTEFKEHYKQHLKTKDEEKFRRAGHKIKPVAQMLGLQQIVDEYEHGKSLLWEEESDIKIQKSISKIDDICSQVLSELEGMTSDQ
ncbi:MAG: taurine dioxygenase [Balneola sp.]